MVEVKLETGDNATGLGKSALWIIIAFLIASVVFAVVGIIMFFFLMNSGLFAT